MPKKVFFLTALCFLFPLLLPAQTPFPPPEATYSLTLESNDYSTTVLATPRRVYLNPRSAPLLCIAGEEVNLEVLDYPKVMPPPCGDYTTAEFIHWEIDPLPSYSVNLNNKQITLIMDQNYVVTVVARITNHTNIPCNELQLYPPETHVIVGQEFTTGLDLTIDRIGILYYCFTLTYDPDIITPDFSKGTDGVEAAADGFLISVDSQTPGEIIVGGFNDNGPSETGNLRFLTFYWLGGPGTGQSELNVQIVEVGDEFYTPLYFVPFRSTTTITINVLESVLYGDANNDGVVNIIDALMVARYAVGLPEKNINIAAADVNQDDIINIVDALLILQYRLGIIPALPI